MMNIFLTDIHITLQLHSSKTVVLILEYRNFNCLEQGTWVLIAFESFAPIG